MSTPNLEAIDFLTFFRYSNTLSHAPSGDDNDNQSLASPRCEQVRKKDHVIAMPTPVQTFDGMIAELLGQGTVAGCATVAELKTDGVGVELFVREENIDNDSRLRKLAGVALRRNLTYVQLLEVLHEEFVQRLHKHLLGLSEEARRAQSSPLLEEILCR